MGQYMALFEFFMFVRAVVAFVKGNGTQPIELVCR